jgi:hypothetical protein
MKLKTLILTCILAAGLAGLIPGTAQAGPAINNIIYTPLNIKLHIQYNDSKGKIHQASLTSKDLLKLMSLSTKDKFATDYDGHGDGADVYVIENNSAIADLTTNGIFTIDFTNLVSWHDQTGRNGTFTETEKGVLSLNFDFSEFIQPTVIAQDVPSGNEFLFEATGVYFFQRTGAAVKNGSQKITTTLDASRTVGVGGESTVSLGVQPDVSIPSASDFLIKAGTVGGSGSDTVGID